MIKNKLARKMCVLATVCCLGFASVPVSAATIDFNVTVGGSGSQDPLSQRTSKNDGEQRAYFTPTYSSVGSGAALEAFSYKIGDSSTKTSSVYMGPGNLGYTQTAGYKKTAAAGLQYAMQSVAAMGRINLKGKYCP